MEKAKFIVATNWYKRIKKLETIIERLEDVSSDLTGVSIDVDIGEKPLYIDDTSDNLEAVFDSILEVYRAQLQQAEDYFKDI